MSSLDLNPQAFGIAASTRRALGRVHDAWAGPGLRIELPGGGRLSLGDRGAETPAILRVHRYRALRRALTGGDIGFAEGYMAADWNTPDLPRLLAALAANFEALTRFGLGSAWHRLFQFRLKWLQANTPAGSRRNIHAHYDLGNAFYAAWLDPGMTYSGALYAHPDEPLEAAQRRKYAALADAIGLQRGHKVLEIGCGWGGFAEFAAREVGARVTAVTISAAQYDYARRRIERAGLADQAAIRLCDYREVDGCYDRVVSIEMLEAVGERYWPVFFDRLRERLAPGGRAGLQVITIRDDLFDDYRRRVDFIQRYVFPGGMLASEHSLSAAARRAGLVALEPPRRFGRDYARTLADWSERFERAWPGLRGGAFDERFGRLWRFYLAYCQAGFATGRTDVIQVALQRP
jgi:cyclopropane-fatty-acyl-phospholipid synthase